MAEAAAIIDTDSEGYLFTSVPPEQLHLVWPKLEPLVKRFFLRTDGSDFGVGDMLSRLASGQWKMWAILRDGEVVAGVVFSVQQVGSERKIWVHMVAGVNMREWAEELQNLMEDYRVLVGAKSIGATSRLGMERLGRAMGWKRKAVVMELDNG